MPHCSLAAGDGPSSRTHQSQAAVSSNSWSLTKLARASAGGASGGRVRRAILSAPPGAVAAYWPASGRRGDSVQPHWDRSPSWGSSVQR